MNTSSFTGIDIFAGSSPNDNINVDNNDDDANVYDKDDSDDNDYGHGQDENENDDDNDNAHENYDNRETSGNFKEVFHLPKASPAPSHQISLHSFLELSHRPLSHSNFSL